MDGVRVETDDGVAVAVVDFISDELRNTLRQQLSTYCHGAVQVAEDSSFYSFQNTMRQFVERYESKAKTIQLGMAGELLTHLLLEQSQFELTSAGIFFNKEEKHIKKGFDLTFYEDSGMVWYGEVKSGEKESGTSNEKAHALLVTAANDLFHKLEPGAPRSRWESALIDAGLTLQSEDATTMKRLLRADATAIQEGLPLPISAVIAAIVFHSPLHCSIDMGQVVATAASLSRAGKFKHLKALAAQQPVFDDLISFIRVELAAIA